MNLQRVTSLMLRVFFVAAFVLLVLAVAEKIANIQGYTLVSSGGYAPSRLLEFAVVSLVFVIAVLLREIREELKRLKG